MKTIPLSRGQFAIVDDSDFKELSHRKWQCSPRGYAVTTTSVKNRTVLTTMHRMVMSAPAGMSVDHINGNRLDNRKSNLRLTTHAQNCKNNKVIRRSNTSGYKGVSWSKAAQKWEARIKVNYKSVYLGLFKTPVEAAKAYDIAARQLHGQYCRTNFELG